MSQVSIIDIEGNNPQIPTEFVTNDGSAIPIGNILEILGQTVPADSNPIYTTGSGNTVTINSQLSQDIAASDATKVGLAAFDSSAFSVDSNGFVSFVGTLSAIDSIGVDASTAPGTDPVTPDLNGLITVTGAQTTAGSVGANVIRTNSLSANAYTIQIQQSTSSVAENTTLNGVSHFNSSHFSVSNGFVSLAGGGSAIDSITTDQGAPAVVPDVNGNINIVGGTGMNVTGQGPGSTVTVTLETPVAVINGGTGSTGIVGIVAGDGTVYNGRTLQQPAAGLTIANPSGASGDPTFALADDLAALEGLSGSGYAVRTAANTWALRTFQEGTGITLTNADGVAGNTTIAVDSSELPTIPTSFPTDSGTAIPAANALTIAGGTGIDTSGAGATVTVTFDVTEVPSIATTYNADSGSATPAANVLTVAGGAGCSTSATGSTVTVNVTGGGYDWIEVTGTSQTAAINTGYILNNAGLVTLTLPSTAAVGDTVRVCGKGAGGWRVAQNSGDQIHFGNQNTTAGVGGRLDSNNRYDCVELLCTVANDDWTVLSSVGNITVT